MRAIDADALEKDGWMMHRIVRVDKNTMSYQTKKPTDFPTIEPERKTGKWIRTRTVEHDGELYCDQCGQEHPEQKLIWNYCPNCGADMRGEQP